MASESGLVSKRAWQRVGNVVRQVEGRRRSLVPKRKPRGVPASGNGCNCPVRIQFYTWSGPASGTFTWRFGNPLSTGNDLVVNYDDTTEEVVTAINALPMFTGVKAVTPNDTALPASAVIVELPKGTALPTITPHDNSFDDGGMKVSYRP